MENRRILTRRTWNQKQLYVLQYFFQARVKCILIRVTFHRIYCTPIVYYVYSSNWYRSKIFVPWKYRPNTNVEVLLTRKMIRSSFVYNIQLYVFKKNSKILWQGFGSSRFHLQIWQLPIILCWNSVDINIYTNTKLHIFKEVCLDIVR